MSAQQLSIAGERRQAPRAHDELMPAGYVSTPPELIPNQVRLQHRGLSRQEAMGGYVEPAGQPTLMPGCLADTENGLCIVPHGKAVALERKAKNVLCIALGDSRHVL